MWLSTVASLAAVLLPLISASDQHNVSSNSPLDSAYNILRFLRSRHLPPVYTENNIYNGLKIPEYDTDTHDYLGLVYLDSIHTVRNQYLEAMAVVEAAAEAGDATAMITVADHNMFGYVAPPNYTHALSYYHRAVETEPSGHGYFMLGLAYSTGLFGDVERDQARALLYYQFAMENGSKKATMALAYKHLYGLGVPPNCDLALHHYTHLGHHGMAHIGDHYEENPVAYNIRIADFNGGLYGNKLSESPTLIFSRYHQVESSLFVDDSLDYDVPSYIDQYFEALAHYEGDYFRPANYSKAFEVLSHCMDVYKRLGGSFRSTREMRFFHRSFALQGHMHLYGQGVPRNVTKAVAMLEQLRTLSPDATADIGYIVEKGLNETEPNPSKAIEVYAQAAKLSSPRGRTALARILLEQQGYNRDENTNLPEILQGFKTAASDHDTMALYYVGELLQANVGALSIPSKPHQCETTIIYYKVFAERLEALFVPELEWAFRELAAGRYKNALLGYLIGAELGLANAQVLAAHLLYQLQPLSAQFGISKKSSHSSSRVEAAVAYLEQASVQKDVDATILLGDIYFYGVDGTDYTPDYDKAYAMYNRAANHQSSHGCYSLAYMYEYGLGPVNNTVDYFMAKRFYDLSLLYQGKDYTQVPSTNSKVPINLALLRLRLKDMFTSKKSKGVSADENNGWFSAFRSINQKAEPVNEVSNDRARAHHEGTNYEVNEDYDAGDYLVIAITLMFFVVFFVQSFMQMRRLRHNNGNQNNGNQNNGNQNNGNQNNGNQNQNQANVPNNPPQNGWNGNQFNFRRGNFEFHFFAL